jgi:molybdopterin converting factor small subunit
LFGAKKKETFAASDKVAMLDKLREKYRKAQQQYGARLFDMQQLENRISFQRANQSDFQRFIIDEMNFFKQMQEKGDEEIAKRKRQEEADARMREIMAANDALIAHYPDVFFHPLATLECRRLVGAVSNLFPEIDADLRYVFQGRKEWGEISFYLADLERFIYKPPMRMTAFLAAYVAQIQKWGETGRDDADRKFLQTAAMCLTGITNELKTNLDALIDTDKARASAIIARLDAIVADFRLTDWAQHGLTLKAQKKLGI